MALDCFGYGVNPCGPSRVFTIVLDGKGGGSEVLRPLTVRQHNKYTRDKVVQHMEKNVWVVTHVYGDNYYDVQKGSTLVLNFDFSTGTLSPTGNYDNDNPVKHDRVFNSTGEKLHEGDQCLLGYRGQDIKQKPFIKSIYRRPFGQQTTVTSNVIEILIGRWVQSNRSPEQSTLGTRIQDPKYRIGNGAASTWYVPNTSSNGNYDDAAAPVGLAWVYYDESPVIDRLSCGFPVRRYGDVYHDFAICMFDIATQSIVWKAEFEVGEDWPLGMSEANTAKFFYDQTYRWSHMIPYPQRDNPKMYSAYGAATKIVNELPKIALGANVVGPYLALPYMNDAVRSYAHYYVDGFHAYWDLTDISFRQADNFPDIHYPELKIYQQSQNSYTYEEVASYNFKDECGYDRAIPVPNKGFHYTSSIRNNEPIACELFDPPAFQVFTSAIQGLNPFDTQQNARAWSYLNEFSRFAIGEEPLPDKGSGHYFYGKECKWLIKSFGIDGSSGSQVEKVIEATQTPKELPETFFDAEAQAQWLLDGNSGYYSRPYLGSAWWDDLAIATPLCYSDSTLLSAVYEAQRPDYEYLTYAPVLLPVSVNSSRKYDVLDCFAETGWPNYSNALGGITVENGSSEGFATSWFAVLEPVQTLYGGIVNNQGSQSSSLYAPERVGTVEVYQTAPGVYNIDGIGTSIGIKQHLKAWYVRNQATLWRTMLYGVAGGTIVSETDISQTFNNVSYSGDYGSALVNNVELGDNVWKIISFPESSLVAVLRDLHSDGFGFNPSPHLEIYDTSSNPAVKMSSTALGTTDLLTVAIPALSAVIGDRQWDPYWAGPPRMKACLDYAAGAPVLQIFISENKKVDVGTQSQFRRITYHSVVVTDPSAPTVTTDVYTSADPGVGNSPQEPNTGGAPMPEDFDTLILTHGKAYYTHDSKIYERQ